MTEAPVIHVNYMSSVNESATHTPTACMPAARSIACELHVYYRHVNYMCANCMYASYMFITSEQRVTEELHVTEAPVTYGPNRPNRPNKQKKQKKALMAARTRAIHM